MQANKTPAGERLSRIAARQHCVVDLDDLRSIGVPRSTVGLWAREQRIHRVYAGVYSVIPPSLLSLEGQWLAAVKAGGPSSALSHGPAGHLQWLVDRDAHRAMHVTVAGRFRRRPKGVVVHRPVIIEPADFTVKLGIPVTTPTRTVWDLAAIDLPSVTRRAFERADAKGEADRARLQALVDDCPNHRGIGLIRKLLAEGHLPLSEVRSWLEGLLLHVCSEHGLPLPAVNVPLLGYEADFLWEREKFIVEADGGDHLTPRQRDKDNERDIAFGRAGYLPRRYSSTAMKREREVAEEVRSILEERRPR